jgi:transcriptional regulator with XRE-family HTH domain
LNFENHRSKIVELGMKRKPTEIGKILRKLRADAGETAGVMAGKLGVTASYLSAIELGKRRMTKSVADQIIFLYDLSGQDREQIMSESVNGKLKLDLHGATAAQINTARMFAEHFRDLDLGTLFKIELLIGQALYWHSRNTGMKFPE